MGDFISLDEWRQSVTATLEQIGETTGRLLPAIVGAVLILVIGWGVSRLVQAVARRALHRVGLDRTATRLRLTESLQKANVTSAPSAIVARVLFWILMLTFVVAAADTLGLDAMTTPIDRLIAYLPNVVAAALIIVLGLILGRFVRRLVKSGAAMASLPEADKLGAATHGIVILVIGVVAVEQLGLKTDILVTVITVLVATFGLTTGLAFALGSRTLVTHILAGHYLRQTLASGESVEVGGRKGTVERVGAVNTVFRKGERSWTVPNAALLEDVVLH